MCPSDDHDSKPFTKSLKKTNQKLEKLDKEVREIRETMERTNQKLDALLARLAISPKDDQHEPDKC